MSSDAPSRVASNNAAENTRDENEATREVTAAEVAAPGSMISGAPDEALYLPVVPIRDCNLSFPLSLSNLRNAY